jgi:enamine deaminase RidA (YjgF/YER057c/UK114 family)
MRLSRYDPPRPYARSSRVGNVIFLAGATGMGEHEEGAGHDHLAKGGIREQATVAFEQVAANLAAEGLGFEDLARLDVFLLNSEDGPGFMEVCRRYLPDGAPPGAMVSVSGFSHKGCLVEIEGIAAARE